MGRLEIIKEPLSSVVDELRKNDYFVKYFSLDDKEVLVFERKGVVGRVKYYPNENKVYIDYDVKDKIDLSNILDDGKLEVKTLEGAPLFVIYEGKADLGKMHKVLSSII